MLLKYSSLNISMKVIIFNDLDNFNGSLNIINKDLEEEEKRFWDIDKYIPFLLEKIKSLDKSKFSKEEVKLIKTHIYTGRYSSKILYGLIWSCKNKIKEIQNIISRQKGGGNIQFEPKTKNSAIVMTDPHLLRQVVHNMLTNAVRYSLGKKYDIIVRLEESADRFVVSVQDFGIGIPEEAKPHIFEKFFRSENAFIKEPDGTGVGMYTAKMIMEEFGGKIWFDSTVNKGTTFYISLPKSKTTISSLPAK